VSQLRLLGPEVGAPVQFVDGRIDGPIGKAPVIVSNGVGTDSVAMLIEMQRRGIVPDHIITALVGQGAYGNEHPRFYAYIPLLNEWLASVGFPQVELVWYALKKKAKHYHYESLAGNCISNRTLPSIAFRRNHSCSLKWKGEQIDAWVTRRYGSEPCYRLVGYDCTETGRVSRFSTKTDPSGPRANDYYVHPLQLWGFTRADCIEIIEDAGLPQPGKSSCVFCPSMKDEELDELDTVALWLIVIIEAHASINFKKIKGLRGHDGSMTEYIVANDLLPASLVNEVWVKWSAVERPSELADNPAAVADEVLFQEANRLAAQCDEFVGLQRHRNAPYFAPALANITS
jgi:hypothetical protein